MRNEVRYIDGTEQAINEQIDSFSCKPQADTHVLMNVPKPQVSSVLNQQGEVSRHAES